MGYIPEQPKVAVIELDKNDPQQTGTASLMQLNSDGTSSTAYSAAVKIWGAYYKYNYVKFDFSSITTPGIYYIQYGKTRTNDFIIDEHVYDKITDATTDVWVPIHMNHMYVTEGYRTWHGEPFKEGYLQAPESDHFDLHSQGPTTDTKYKPLELIPGLNIGGFFDAGHLDVTCDFKAAIDASEKDTLRFDLSELHARDSVTGFDVRHLQAQARLAGKQLLLTNVQVQQKRTQLHIDSARMQLPNKRDSIPFSFHTGTITGTVYLQDISRAFAPVLSKFTLPLQLSCTMSGNQDKLSFRHVKVGTTDKRLAIAATGDITNLKSKEKLTVLFHVARMTAKSGIKERIISQFPVKRLMMTQLHNLGNISYTGSFRVIRKEERFWGTLGTAVGSLKFQFWLDERNKYVVGNASTQKLHFGKVMGMKDVGPLAAKADFKIDISKPRTAVMRRKLGGKLPIGKVSATIADCSYKGVHVRNVDVNVTSDGAVATGDVIQRGNWRDLSCSFSFTDTNQMHKLKVSHGRMKFHKMSNEARQAKRERKEARKAERQAKREAKKAEKAAKKKSKKSFLFF